MWWEATDNGQMSITKVPVQCPVCKTILEYRYPDAKLWTYCQECKSDFYFPPNKERPTKATPDSLKHHTNKCGCGRCGK